MDETRANDVDRLKDLLKRLDPDSFKPCGFISERCSSLPPTDNLVGWIRTPSQTDCWLAAPRSPSQSIDDILSLKPLSGEFAIQTDARAPDTYWDVDQESWRISGPNRVDRTLERRVLEGEDLTALTSVYTPALSQTFRTLSKIDADNDGAWTAIHHVFWGFKEKAGADRRLERLHYRFVGFEKASCQ